MTTSQIALAQAGHKIAGIARSTQQAVTIDLLSLIDGTVDALTGIAKVMEGFTEMLCAAHAEIVAAAVVEGEYIDADDEAIGAMESTEQALQNYLTKLVVKRAAIDKDLRLKDHHCEALHDAYEAAMNAAAVLVEELQNARAAIITHDLKAEPRANSETFATVESLIASLRNA